ICFLLSYMVGISAFWINRISGLRRMKRGLILFLSGGMIPIAFFPQWFIGLSNYLPFQYIRYVPINIYLGQYSISAAGFNNIGIVLGAQIAWTLILLGITHLMWKAAIKKFSGAGA
ncbi:MAG: ABC-2 family transporter protein, partial [Nanoarchaeota archaeon]|nr:ABC-2 family transporter protein [Nanoarchaeota archaeon]